MTGKKLKAKIDSLGLLHSFVAAEIGTNKSDLSLALSEKKDNPRMKEIRALVAKYLKKRK